MKRPTKAVEPIPTFEEKVAMIQDVMEGLLDPMLIDYQSGVRPETALVSWTFGAKQYNRLCRRHVLTITAKYDTINMANIPTYQHAVEWVALGSVTREDVVNALFHTLSFPGSCYWFDADMRWHKRGILYG